MIELIIFAIIFYAGYQLGLTVMGYRLRHLVYKEAKRLGIVTPREQELLRELEEEEKPKVIELSVEKINDILYLYELKTDDFVCQGKSLDELAEFSKRYNGIKYAAVIDKNTDAVFAFVDGKVDLTIVDKIKT